jgi:hypothetical protein
MLDVSSAASTGVPKGMSALLALTSLNLQMTMAWKVSNLVGPSHLQCLSLNRYSDIPELPRGHSPGGTPLPGFGAYC